METWQTGAAFVSSPATVLERSDMAEAMNGKEGKTSGTETDGQGTAEGPASSETTPRPSVKPDRTKSGKSRVKQRAEASVGSEPVPTPGEPASLLGGTPISSSLLQRFIDIPKFRKLVLSRLAKKFR